MKAIIKKIINTIAGPSLELTDEQSNDPDFNQGRQGKIIRNQYFIQKGPETVKEATLRAFNMMPNEFNLNSIVVKVRSMLYPYRPESTSISMRLRELRTKHKISYTADNIGVYKKNISQTH